MNKIVRFRGNDDTVPQEAGNLYVSNNKVIFIDQAKKQMIFASAEEADAVANNTMLIDNRLKLLEQQILALKTKDAAIVEVSENVNQPDSDIVIQSSTPVSDKKTVVAKSITVKQQDISNGTISYQATEDVNISNLTTEGNLAKTVSNAQISINNDGYVQITNSNINQTGYNAIEIGLQKTVKTVLIDNVTFNSELANNAISIFDTEDNATVTISNCNFVKCSNPLRISNRSGNKVTINIVNCNFGQWEQGQYAGCVLCQDYTSATAQEAQQNNLFEENKVNINFINCYHNGQKIAFTDKSSVCGTKNDNQLVYVYTNKEGFIDFNDGSRYPTVTAK